MARTRTTRGPPPAWKGAGPPGRDRRRAGEGQAAPARPSKSHNIYYVKYTRRGRLSPAEARVLDFNRRMGVSAGYTVSFRAESRRAKGAIALIARPGLGQEDADALWARRGDEVVLMNTVARLRILALPHSGGRQLTPRQREVLQWVGDSKTAADIALLMGLTPATVEKHLRLAREALDVETTAQAVLKASFFNQMFVLDA